MSALAALMVVGNFAYVLSANGWLVLPFQRSAAIGQQHAGGLALSSTRIPVTTRTAPSQPPAPAPHPNLLADARMGCTSGKPAVLPGVIFDGTNRAARATPPQEVALTFDDGPTPYSSPPILAYLEQTHTPATFLVEGQYVHLWPYLVQREWKDGFAIGVHTWDHPDMTLLGPAQRQFQLDATLKALHKTLGQNACIWFWRPPYGAFNSAVVQSAANSGLSTICWDVDPLDWTRPGTDVIVSSVLSQVHAGSIILLHDGPELREQTLAALPAILAGLQAQGLEPVTVPKLLTDGSYAGISVSR